MHTIHRARAGLLALLLLTLAGPAAADGLLQQARGLMDAGKADAAYELLAPREDARAGDPEFDYLLGIAALDSGRPTQAVFALERVLAVEPDHAQARAEIGRAYYELNETGRARRAFEQAMPEAPLEARASMQGYLDAIEQLRTPDKTQISGHLSLTLGRDTNVNAGPSISQVAVPVFGGLLATLDNTGAEQDSGFSTAAGGVSVRHALSNSLSLVANGALSQRWNFSASRFDTGSLRADVGLSLSRGADTFTGAVQAEHFELDRQSYRNAYGLVAQWQRDLNPRSQVSAWAQATRLDYADTARAPRNSLRNANRYVAGLAYARAFSSPYAPVLYASLYGGEEAELASNVEHLGHTLVGVRVGGQARLSGKALLFAAAKAEDRSYGGTDPLFLVQRDDQYYDVRVGLRYALAPDWTVTPEAGYTRDNSNIPVNDYDRATLAVTVRRDFD